MGIDQINKINSRDWSKARRKWFLISGLAFRRKPKYYDLVALNEVFTLMITNYQSFIVLTMSGRRCQRKKKHQQADPKKYDKV
jgi:hypothetical protein